ncbi:MAG: undecaprenyl-phosphate glucose phosphotransferase [Geminicoccales bacterium]
MTIFARTGFQQADLASRYRSGWLSRRLRPFSSVFLDATRLFLSILTGFTSGIVAFFAYYYPAFDGDLELILYFFQSPDDRYLHLSLLGGLIFANVTFAIYGRPLRRNNDDLLKQVVTCWAISLSIILGILFMLKAGSTFSRGLISVWALIGLPFFFVARILEKRITGFLTHKGLSQRWVAIVGATPHGERLAERLTESDLSGGIHVVGIFDETTHHENDTGDKVPVSGDLHALKQLCREDMLDSVIIALPGDDPDRVRAVANELHALPTDVLLGPDLVQLELRAQAAPRLGPIPLASISKAPMQDWWGVVKWLEDVAISSIALILLTPVLVTIAVAIKINSPGPVLFRQRRFGFNNQEFYVYKFRSMHQALCDDGGAEATTRNDRRVTPLGRFLRRTSLDELPQLLNVLRGEMSIVGPRAHPVDMRLGDQLIHHRIREYAARHRVKPGITGLAQVNGNRGEVKSVEKAEQRVRFDLLYIENWSVWLDLEIIFKTVFKMAFDREAY